MAVRRAKKDLPKCASTMIRLGSGCGPHAEVSILSWVASMGEVTLLGPTGCG